MKTSPSQRFSFQRDDRGSGDWAVESRSPGVAHGPILSLCRRILNPFAAPLQAGEVPSGCLELIRRACAALREDDVQTAGAQLDQIEQAWPRSRRWAVYCNLRAVVHEIHGQLRQARRWYRRAVFADREFLPARQNVRRLYELSTFGVSDVDVALGDEA